MYILTTDGLPHLKNLPRACAQINVLKQELVPLQPPPQQPYPVFRVVTTEGTKMEPSAGEKILLDVRVCMKESTESKMEPE